MSDAKQFAEDAVAAMTARSQLRVSAQQVKVATILARAENADVLTLDDLVAQKYLRSVPLPYAGETDIDGPLLELAPATPGPLPSDGTKGWPHRANRGDDARTGTLRMLRPRRQPDCVLQALTYPFTPRRTNQPLTCRQVSAYT